MSRCHRLLLGALLAAVVVGCGRQKADEAPEVRVDCQVDPRPPRQGPAKVTLTLTGADGQPVRGATLRVEGNMNHAGMKPVFADAREAKPGRYEADLTFTMGGDWFLLVEGRLSDGRRLERKIDVPGVHGQ
jgi:hypothetical protein